MAKITTITNPLTGQPTQVDQLEHTAQQIDDAITRALPGGAIDITLANKAPAGYGLGSVHGNYDNTDLNDCLQNGWYQFGSSVANTPPGFSYGSMLVLSKASGINQLVFSDSGDGKYQSVIWVRHNENGTWGEWECMNPPMLLGVEYRTTERHLGKPVYVQRINFNGALPANGNGQGIINTLPIATTNIIDINVTIKNRTTLEVQRLPSVSASGSVTAICNPLKYGDYDNYAFRITVFTDMSGWDYQRLIVKYTKSTD